MGYSLGGGNDPNINSPQWREFEQEQNTLPWSGGIAASVTAVTRNGDEDFSWSENNGLVFHGNNLAWGLGYS